MAPMALKQPASMGRARAVRAVAYQGPDPRRTAQKVTAPAKGIVTSVPGAPVTELRPPPVDLEKVIPQPSVPRANKAISREKPEGSDPRLAREDYSVMQQHIAFFDRDDDGVLWPGDTYVGFRRIGFNPIISAFAVPFIHGSFSYPTQENWVPDPLFRIRIKNIHRGKHGGDSEVYDTEGRFVPDKFEAIFTKFDKENKGGLTLKDINTMIGANQNVFDPVGWVAARLEWWALWLVCKDDNGFVTKEMMRAQYDGSLWYIKAEQNERKKLEKKQRR